MARFFRQVVELSHRTRSPLPSRHPLVLGHRAIEGGKVGREFVVQLAVDFISCAQRDLLERIEHIELRDREIGESVDARGIAHDHRVEPAATTRTPRGRAVLVAQLARFLADRKSTPSELQSPYVISYAVF